MAHADNDPMSGQPVFHWLGRVEYARARALQTVAVERRQRGATGDTVLLLEHPHVITLGRRGRMEDVLLDAAGLALRGIAVHQADRGGAVTYHGPGQLVAYPIMDIRALGGPVRYVRALEAALIDALAGLGVQGRRQDGMPGVWVGGRKMAAIGLRVSRGISSHGFSLNVSTDLAYFQHIIACGVPHLPVTSVERELGAAVDAGRVRSAVAEALAHRLWLPPVWAQEADTEGLLAEADAGPVSR